MCTRAHKHTPERGETAQHLRTLPPPAPWLAPPLLEKLRSDSARGTRLTGRKYFAPPAPHVRYIFVFPSRRPYTQEHSLNHSAGCWFPLPGPGATEPRWMTALSASPEEDPQALGIPNRLLSFHSTVGSGLFSGMAILAREGKPQIR